MLTVSSRLWGVCVRQTSMASPSMSPAWKVIPLAGGSTKHGLDYAVTFVNRYVSINCKTL
jgi:hypothetical protein